MAGLLPLGELLKRYENKPIGKNVRAYEEGEGVLNAGLLMLCGITNQMDEEFHIFALCRKVSQFNSIVPHEIHCTVKKNSIASMSCSCASGISGHCKHSVAVLMHLIRTPVDSLEKVSCTDIQQQWGQLKKDTKDMYATVPVNQFCHGMKNDKKKKKIHSNHNFIEEIMEEAGMYEGKMCALSIIKTQKYASTALPQSETSVDKARSDPVDVLNGILSLKIANPIQDETALYINESLETVTFQNISGDEKEFFKKHIQVTEKEAIEIAMETVLQSGSKWKDLRKLRITASVAYGFFTSRTVNKISLDAKIKRHLDDSFQGNSSTTYGKVNEPRARKCYEDVSGEKVVLTGLLINPCIPWLGFSPDGIVVGKKIIEIKCPVIGKKETAEDMFRHLKFFDENCNIKQNHSYYCQVQLGMFVTGLRECDLILYSSKSDSCLLKTIVYNESIVEQYLKKLQHIYFAYMLPKLAEKQEV